MATPKRWSRTVGTQRGNRIRVYEREPGGKLYAAVWDPERHKYTQTGLGHRDRERALRDVGELVRLRESGDDLSGPLQLGTVVARYLAESTHTRDGSLKTAQYMKGCAVRDVPHRMLYRHLNRAGVTMSAPNSERFGDWVLFGPDANVRVEGTLPLTLPSGRKVE